MIVSAVDNNGRLIIFAPLMTRTSRLVMLPPGIAGLVWQNLTPVEQHYFGATCRGALADRVSIDGKKRGDFLCDINVFFSFARENFQTNVFLFEERIAILIDDLTLINKGEKLIKIYVEFLNLFLSLSNEDLAKTDGIDYLPLSDLRGEIISALAIASLTRAALPDAQGIAGIENINEILIYPQLHEIRKEIKVFELLVIQDRCKEAFKFVDELPVLSIWWKRWLRQRALGAVCDPLIHGKTRNLGRLLQILNNIITNYVDLVEPRDSLGGFLDQIASDTSYHFLDRRKVEDNVDLDSVLELAKKLWKKGKVEPLEKMVPIFSKHKFFDRAIEVLDILGPGLPIGERRDRCYMFFAVVEDLCEARRFSKAKVVAKKMLCGKQDAKKHIFIKRHPILVRICRVFFSMYLRTKDDYGCSRYS